MNSLTQLAGMFGRMAAGGYKQQLSPVLDMLGNAVKAEVEKEIGEYQSSISPFSATEQLADATLERKTRANLGKNGNADSPLWATGDFQASIQTAKDVSALTVEIGSNLDYVVYSELGTSKEPPRPVFGPAALRAIPLLLPAVAAAGGNGMAGGVWSGLGVKGTTRAGGHDVAEIQP